MKVSRHQWLAHGASVLVISLLSTGPAFGQAAGAGQSGQKPAQPAQQGQTGQASSAPVVTPAENQAWQDLSAEATAGLDPDKVITLAQNYEKTYPASPMLTEVYLYEASAQMSKNNFGKAVEAGEQSLKLNGDNLRSLLFVSGLLPQPQVMQLQASADGKLKKLDEAESDAKHGLDMIAQGKIPHLPNETDDAYKKRTNQISSGPHAALGMVHLQRSTMGLGSTMDPDELGKAAQEFKQSVDLADPQQPGISESYYRLGEIYKHQNKIDDAIAAFSKASELSQGTGLQTYADKQVEELKKAQTQAKPAGAH